MIERNIPGTSGQTAVFDWTQYYHVIICVYCDGEHHPQKCPRVEEIEYYPNQAIKRVKLREIKPVTTGGFPRTTTG
jgi:hypothetical protein